jgi:hypothetical protein
LRRELDNVALDTIRLDEGLKVVMSQNKNLNNRLFSIKDCEGLPPRRRLKGD